MNDNLSFPEEYDLKDTLGRCYKLLVNTDTDRWYFKILFGKIPAGHAVCTQDGEDLLLQEFNIYGEGNVPDGIFNRLYHRLVGASSSFRGRGLGSALLHFIIRRAKDFVASYLCICVESPDALIGWFERHGFEQQPHESGTARIETRFNLKRETEKADSQSSLESRGATSSKRSKRPFSLPRKSATTKVRKTERQSSTPTNSRRRFTKEGLAKLLRPTSDLINGKAPDADRLLDPSLIGSLRASHTLIRHSRDTRVLQYHINAREQPTIFHRHHFKYAVQYDPFGTMAGTQSKNFCIEFYINKIRIYHDRKQMVDRVRSELSRLRISGFKFRETERAFSYDYKFAAHDEEQLIREIRRKLFPLINAVHPMFYRIMDSFNVPMTKAERRALIAGRKKLNPVDRNAPGYRKNMEYRREVSPKLRAQTFLRDGYTCQHCDKKLSTKQLHADHVKPVSRGGLTVLGNLQTLCFKCNLRKGKRLETEL